MTTWFEVMTEVPTKQEMRFMRRESINEALQQGMKSFDEIAAFVREDEHERYGFPMNLFIDWNDGWDFGGGVDDPRY